VRNLIKKILLQEISINVNRDDYKWRKSVTTGPKPGKSFKRNQVRTFKTPKYKYIVDTEEYDEDFYVISFYPKLNDSWYNKQQKLRDRGEPFHSKYSHQTEEGQQFKIFGLLIRHMEEILKENPLASFGYFGAPNIHTGNNNKDVYDTKRYKIYGTLLNDQFNDTHFPTEEIERFSGGLLINREKSKEIPREELVRFGTHILNDYL
jgi:hypothetical protein